MIVGERVCGVGVNRQALVMIFKLKRTIHHRYCSFGC